MPTPIKHLLKDRNALAVMALTLVVGLALGWGAHGLATPTRSGFASGTPGSMMGSASSRSARSGMSQAGVLSGTVASKDASSITIDTRDGSSRVVLVTPTTNYSKSVAGSIDDIAVGSTIFVSGTPSTDGSIAASLIQLRPAMTSATPPAGQ